MGVDAHGFASSGPLSGSSCPSTSLGQSSVTKRDSGFDSRILTKTCEEKGIEKAKQNLTMTDGQKWKNGKMDMLSYIRYPSTFWFTSSMRLSRNSKSLKHNQQCFPFGTCLHTGRPMSRCFSSCQIVGNFQLLLYKSLLSGGSKMQYI